MDRTITSMDIIKTIEQLDRLKENYGEHCVSLLVGAGFSKNAFQGFPSWTELLFDMADELYNDEITRGYDRYWQTHPSYRGGLKEYKKKVIPSLIASKGYLPMVSEYIKRKGFREAVEFYIEERIPYIDEEAGMFMFTGKNAGLSYPIVKEDFAAHLKVFDGAWEQIYTTNYDHLLEYAYMMSGRDGYDDLVIKEAPQLSIGRGPRTVIKLHGDLQHPGKKRDFVFDGNPHQQYIISEEDYESYPKQHEAFTQLMRISLLQGVFCLVGFSGDDPNFQAWLSWVRDILFRSNRKKEYKIFLIDKSSELASPSKQLFYENHNTCYIPLENPDVKRHIGSTASGFRELLCDFFEFLYRDYHGVVGFPKSATTPSPSYGALWSRLDLNLSEYTEHEEDAEAIIKAKSRNRIVQPGYYEEEFLRKADSQDALSATDAHLALIALQDTGLPLSSFGKLPVLLEQSIPDVFRSDLVERLERSALLKTESMSTLSEPVTYTESLLKALFSLDFKQARTLLDMWKVSGVDVIKKAYYLSFFDEEQSKRLLIEFIERSLDAKECFFATRLIRFLEYNLTPIHPISYYTSLGVTDYMKVGESLYRSLTEKKKEVHPHGDGRNTKTIYMDGGPIDVDYPKAMAILNFHMDAPLGLSFRNFFSLRNATDWYIVHSTIFERHPFAALYYSLQCTDKKVRTRIGQDYAYSDLLASTCLPEILVQLLRAFLSEDTPAFLKPSIIGMAKEVMIAVHPDQWEPLFMRIWKENVITNIKNLNNPRFPEMKSFVYQALDCMMSQDVRLEVISDILKYGNDDNEFAINSLYCLRREGLDGKNDQLARALDVFIESMSRPEQIAIVGNLFSLLTADNKAIVKRKISKWLDLESFDDVAFRASQCFISPRDRIVRKKIIDAICSSPLLWMTGTHNDGHFSSMKSQFLSVTSYDALRFPEMALLRIYDRLKESVSSIESSRVFESPFYHIMSLEDVLLEMLTFLNQNAKMLSSQFDYEEILAKVEATYKKTVDNHSLEDCLLSIYYNEFCLALDFLEKNKRGIEHQRMMKLISLVLNRVLLMNSDGLDRSLRMLRYFIQDGTISFDDKDQLDLMIMILDRATPERLNECNLNLAHATNNLSAIASLLVERGFESAGITYWSGFTNNKRYYTNFI